MIILPQVSFAITIFHHKKINCTQSNLFKEPFQLSLLISGVGGADGDGDIMKTDNIIAFHQFVLNKTNQKGVHFVMADGVCQICA